MIGLSARVLISISLLVTAVGVLDALLGREWDLLVVFVISMLLQVALWLRHRANRTPVTLRPDLARWLEHQSARTGEPFDDVLDRAVAWYHQGLFVPDRPDRS